MCGSTDDSSAIKVKKQVKRVIESTSGAFSGEGGSNAPSKLRQFGILGTSTYLRPIR